MKITCVSDLHGYLPETTGGDLLIVAGDLTLRDTPAEYVKCLRWIENQRYRKKILVAGNHDGGIESGEISMKAIADIDYLCDAGAQFEGLKIWGSPWTHWFHGVNPRCKAFMLSNEEKLAARWALIPEDTDILVTHSPPHGMLDQLRNGTMCGSYSLQTSVQHIRPKLHVFGHIHEGYELSKNLIYGTTFVNASHVNEHYRNINPPIDIELYLCALSLSV